MPPSPGDPTSEHAMPKPTADALDRFRRATPDDPRVSLRPMFGQLSAFANGYMFAGVFGEDVFVRLEDDALTRTIDQGGSAFAPMPGRPMRGYVVLPRPWVIDEVRLRTAMDESLEFTCSLPAKPPKAPKKPKAPKA
jgi:TfoX/Sxy family transcriptional regulator of competence genes